MRLGAPELIIILIIVVLLFGVGRVGKIAGELGSGIRAFRTGLNGDDEEKKEEPKAGKKSTKAAKPEPEDEVVDAEVVEDDSEE